MLMTAETSMMTKYFTMPCETEYTFCDHREFSPDQLFTTRTKEFQKKRESPHDEGSHVILQIIAWVVGKISLKQKV